MDSQEEREMIERTRAGPKAVGKGKSSIHKAAAIPSSRDMSMLKKPNQPNTGGNNKFKTKLNNIGTHLEAARTDQTTAEEELNNDYYKDSTRAR